MTFTSSVPPFLQSLSYADPHFHNGKASQLAPVPSWNVDHKHHPQPLTNPSLDSLQDLKSVLQAAAFAADKHSTQRRKGANAEPYINHLLEVADLVADALTTPDTNLVIAALLHDTIEDTAVSRDELVSRFGEDVASLVCEVTDDKSLPKHERKRLQVENAPKKTVRAQMIKLADKISNLRSMLSSPPAGWDEQRKKEYFEWAKRVVDGLTAPSPKLKAEFDNAYRAFL